MNEKYIVFQDIILILVACMYIKMEEFSQLPSSIQGENVSSSSSSGNHDVINNTATNTTTYYYYYY